MYRNVLLFISQTCPSAGYIKILVFASTRFIFDYVNYSVYGFYTTFVFFNVPIVF